MVLKLAWVLKSTQKLTYKCMRKGEFHVWFKHDTKVKVSVLLISHFQIASTYKCSQKL